MAGWSLRVVRRRAASCHDEGRGIRLRLTSLASERVRPPLASREPQLAVQAGRSRYWLEARCVGPWL